jgi:hypothetical protein
MSPLQEKVYSLRFGNFGVQEYVYTRERKENTKKNAGDICALFNVLLGVNKLIDNSTYGVL